MAISEPLTLLVLSSSSEDFFQIFIPNSDCIAAFAGKYV